MKHTIKVIAFDADDTLWSNEPFFQEHQIELELLYINDGSRDRTVEEVKKLHEKDSRVHLVSFSRNFGKEAAMYAGLEHSKGDYVVMMDVDLQDPASGNVYPYLGRVRFCCHKKSQQKGRTAGQKLFRKDVLPADEKDFQNRNYGRRKGLPADDPADGGCDSFHAGV